MSWVLLDGQQPGGQFVLPGRNPEAPLNPHTPAQMRAATAANSRTRIDMANMIDKVTPGQAFGAIPATGFSGSDLDPSDGEVLLYQLPDADGVEMFIGGPFAVKNPFDIAFADETFLLIGSFRNDPATRYIIGYDDATNATGALQTLRKRGSLDPSTSIVSSTTHTAVEGILTRLNTTSNNIAVSLPDDDMNLGTEVGFVLTSAGASNKVTITATGTGAAIVGGKLPVVSSVTVELFHVGDMVYLKSLGGNVWCVSHENVALHGCKLEGSDSGAQTISQDSDTNILFATTLFDTGGMADLSNERILIRRTGVYQVQAMVSLNNINDAVAMFFSIRINRNGSNENVTTYGGLVKTDANLSGTTNDYRIPASHIARFDAGDLVTLNFYWESEDTTSENTSTASGNRPFLAVQEIR